MNGNPTPKPSGSKTVAYTLAWLLVIAAALGFVWVTGWWVHLVVWLFTHGWNTFG